MKILIEVENLILELTPPPLGMRTARNIGRTWFGAGRNVAQQAAPTVSSVVRNANPMSIGKKLAYGAGAAGLGAGAVGLGASLIPTAAAATTTPVTPVVAGAAMTPAVAAPIAAGAGTAGVVAHKAIVPSINPSVIDAKAKAAQAIHNVKSAVPVTPKPHSIVNHVKAITAAPKPITNTVDPWKEDLLASARKFKSTTADAASQTGRLVNTLNKARPAGVSFPVGSANRTLSTLGGNRYGELMGMRGSP